MEKNIHPLDMKRASDWLRGVREGLEARYDYYAHTEEGREEAAETAREAARLAKAAGSVAADAAILAGKSLYRKARTIGEAGRDAYHGDYGRAGERIAQMELDRVRGLGRAAKGAADAARESIEKVKNMDEGERREFLKEGLAKAAGFGIILMVASDFWDYATGESDPFEGGLYPAGGVGALPGVEDGELVDASEENIRALAEAGEIEGTESVAEVVRSPEARASFLSMHGLERAPEGFEVHHVVPLSEGGADSPENMVLLSAADHEAVTAMHRDFYGWGRGDFSPL